MSAAPLYPEGEQRVEEGNLVSRAFLLNLMKIDFEIHYTWFLGISLGRGWVVLEKA